MTHQMPSCVANADPHDPEALLVALIAALIAATRDRFAYSRADCICGRSSYLLHREIEGMRRIIREVGRMRQERSRVGEEAMGRSNGGKGNGERERPFGELFDPYAFPLTLFPLLNCISIVDAPLITRRVFNKLN